MANKVPLNTSPILLSPSEEIFTIEEDISTVEDDQTAEQLTSGSDDGGGEEATTSSAIENTEPDDEITDIYQLNLTVAVTEIESEEVNGEFEDALSEIHGEKSFPCSLCNKICKSKGGLTRHTNSKHKATTLPKSSFCMDNLCSIVESIKENIIKEKLYGTELNNDITTASCSQELFNAIQPLYKKFYQKKNQDNLFQSLFGLIPQSSTLLKCQNYKAANLVMIHLPDYLVGFYHKECQGPDSSQDGAKSNGHALKIDPAEHGPLTYIAGYVVSKLFQSSKRNTRESNETLQSLLQSMKSTDQSNTFISARSRGGLVTPSTDLVGILEEAECLFRKHVHVQQTLRRIPTDTICNATLDSPLVKSLWDNIVVTSGVDPSNSTQKLCLENMIKLYLKVRSFSYARDFLTAHKIKEKQTKKKALRKELKISEQKNM